MLTYALSLLMLVAFAFVAWRMRVPVSSFDATRMSTEWRKANWR